MASCKICDGEGVIEIEGKLLECECSLLRRISASMPPYIRKTDVAPQHLVLPIIDFVDKQLFVISAWNDMKAIIKAVMIKYHEKHFRITSDREIRDVYVGSRSATASAATEGDGLVFNNLQDLMDAPDLVIVRLNELSYKNKAAPGALEEALSFRLDRDKPTWVISDTNRSFNEASHAYSESVWDLISSVFTRIIIPLISTGHSASAIMLSPDPVSIPATPTAVTLPAPPMMREESPKKEKKERKIKSYPDDKPATGLEMYGSGLDKPTRGRRR